jgi:5'-nucleotidase/UDP-sugar diphosphatase
MASCSNSNSKETTITIFHVNDVHGQIKNMAKIKHIVDAQKEKNPTILVSAGDMFSGNPVVDNYKDRGYPMIDIMNQTGFNIAAIGNHEYDNGDSVLAVRIAQSNFPWITANADLSNTPIQGVQAYQTLIIDGIKVTFLGLVETGGMQGALIPSTHPWDVANIVFKKAQDILRAYQNLKTKEKADIYIALSHLGHDPSMKGMLGDFEVAEQFPYFDAIIGGHTHEKIDTIINSVPVFQASSYLHYVGKIEFKITNKKIEILNSELIDLDAYPNKNKEVASSVNAYYNDMNPILDEEIGYSETSLNKDEVGSMFTAALKNTMQADLCIQNTGGIRSSLNEGPISIREVYEIDPFNNGTVMYEMSIGNFKKLLKESESGFYYAGLTIKQENNQIIITDSKGKQLTDEVTIKLGMNDYIAAVHHKYFPDKNHNFKTSSSAMLIEYLKNRKVAINHSGKKNYFKFEH